MRKAKGGGVGQCLPFPVGGLTFGIPRGSGGFGGRRGQGRRGGASGSSHGNLDTAVHVTVTWLAGPRDPNTLAESGDAAQCGPCSSWSTCSDWFRPGTWPSPRAQAPMIHFSCQLSNSPRLLARWLWGAETVKRSNTFLFPLFASSLPHQVLAGLVSSHSARSRF